MEYLNGLILIIATVFSVAVAYTRLLDGNVFKKPIVFLSYVGVGFLFSAIGILGNTLADIPIQHNVALYGLLGCFLHYKLIKSLSHKRDNSNN